MNDIEILEKAVKVLTGNDTGIKLDFENTAKAIENLIARNKELEEENKILKNKQTKIIADSFHEKMAEKFDKDFMPKSIIKARIEKLKVLAEKADDETLNACELDIRKNQIYLLQSLLQEGDK